MKIDMKKTKLSLLDSILRKFRYVVNKKENSEKIEQFRELWLNNKQYFNSKNDCQDWIDKAIENPPVNLTEVRLYETTIDYEFFGKMYRCNKPVRKPNVTGLKTSKTKLFNANFNRAISELAIEIKIDDTWHNLFREYLLFGEKALTMIDEFGIKLTRVSKDYRKDKPFEEKFIITITPNTKREDIINLWKNFIEKEKNKMTEYIKIPPNKKVAISK